MADVDNETVVHDQAFEVQPDPTPSIDERVYGAAPEPTSDMEAHDEAVHDTAPDMSETDQSPRLDARRSYEQSVRDDIVKEIADHEKWMADHTDDARAVQLRMQEVAVLQQKLIELDAVKRETRVRQMQTV